MRNLGQVEWWVVLIPKRAGYRQKRRFRFLAMAPALWWAVALLLPAVDAAAQPPSALFDVTDYGAVPNDGLGDGMASRAAIEAATAVGGGVIHYPCGTYTASSNFWLGVFRVNSGENNLWIRGEGAHCVTFEVHPDTVAGNVMASICPTLGSWSCNANGPAPRNIWVSGIRFYDDDPAGHASAGSEETHGLYGSCVGCRYFDLRMDGLGDESIVIRESKDVAVKRVTCGNVGIAGVNAGTCVNIQASEDIRVIDVRCEGGGGDGQSFCVTLESFSAESPIRNVVVDRLVVRDFAGGGIAANVSIGELHGLIIRDADIEVGHPGVASVLLTGSKLKTGVQILSSRLRGPLTLRYSDGLRVRDNDLVADDGDAITIVRGTDAMISGNVIDAEGRCIYLNSGTSASVTSNRCLGPGDILANPTWFKGGYLQVLDNTLEGGGYISANLPNTPVSQRGNFVDGTFD
jgi:hypothetical protein